MKKRPQNENALPIDRRQAFFRIFRYDYRTVLLVSLFLTLFALPALCVVLLCVSGLSVYAEEGDVAAMYALRRWMYLGLVPGLGVFSVGASGGFYVVKKLVWSESGPFLQDFKKGIKSGWLQFLIVTLLFALFALGLSYLADLLVYNGVWGSFTPLLTVFEGFLLFLALCFLLFEYCSVTVYSDKIWSHIKNGFLLALGSFPTTVCAAALALLPFLPMLFFADALWLFALFVTVMALVGFGFGVVVITLHCQRIFDKHINRERFPTLYRRGLYDPGRREEEWHLPDIEKKE